MNLLKGISKPQHCQSLPFSWWGTPKPLGFSFWGLPVVRHHWLRGLLVCPNWRMWSRRRLGIFGMTTQKPCIEHPNGSLIGSLAKGDYTNADHLSCATTFDQLFDWHEGGGYFRMVPQKLMVHHDAKLATNHKTDIHITHICVYSFTYLLIYNTCLFLYTFFSYVYKYICIYIIHHGMPYNFHSKPWWLQGPGWRCFNKRSVAAPGGAVSTRPHCQDGSEEIHGAVVTSFDVGHSAEMADVESGMGVAWISKVPS